MARSTLSERDEQRIGPIAKHEWNVAVHVLHKFFKIHVHNSLPLEPI